MSKSAVKVSEWDGMHDEWAAKEHAHDAAWREYLFLADAVQAKHAAASCGDPDAAPGPDDLARLLEAKKRWEAIARELAALSERMTSKA